MTSPQKPTRRDLLHGAGAAGLVALAGEAAADTPRSDAHLPHARPEEMGLDPRRLQAAFDLLDRWTTGADAPVPGGAILVGRHGKVVPAHFSGRMGPEREAAPIRKDAAFLIASITKPVTYLGADARRARAAEPDRPGDAPRAGVCGPRQGRRGGAAPVHAHLRSARHAAEQRGAAPGSCALAEVPGRCQPRHVAALSPGDPGELPEHGYGRGRRHRAAHFRPFHCGLSPAGISSIRWG